VIVSDAVTGELLAIGNYPTYDSNDYGQHSFFEMRNRAARDTSEPGSLVKIVSLSLAFEDGLVSDDTVFDCSQETVTNRAATVKLPRDHILFGNLTYVDVIRKSRNRVVAFIALMFGEQRMNDGATSLRLGAKTGYGFDSESSGLLYPPNQWDAMRIPRLPMGHWIAGTPIQRNRAMTVFANGGIVASYAAVQKRQWWPGKYPEI
jgi:cell division protein FtsI/penicillin-binding protein 2